MTPEKKYTVTIVTSFDVEIEACSPEDALRQAHDCAVSDGFPSTLSETVWLSSNLDEPVYEWHD